MTTGESLKIKLGLEDLKTVRISRVLDFPIRVLAVYYDSVTSFPVTQQRILRSRRTTSLLRGSKVLVGVKKHLRMTPPMLIEQFTGTYHDSYIIMVDLAGDWLTRKFKGFLQGYTESVERIDEDLEDDGEIVSEHRVLEEDGKKFTVAYFKSHASPRNQHFLKIRGKIEGLGSRLLKEKGAIVWNVDRHVLTVKFQVTPTYSAKEKSAKIILANGRVRQSQFYTTEIAFYDLDKVLTSEQYSFLMDQKASLTKKRDLFIATVIKNAPVKLHSNDMSYYWQGVWEMGDKYGYSLFPFPKWQGAEKGDGTWARRHIGKSSGIYLTKHLLELLTIVSSNAMAILQNFTAFGTPGKEDFKETNKFKSTPLRDAPATAVAPVEPETAPAPEATPEPAPGAEPEVQEPAPAPEPETSPAPAPEPPKPKQKKTPVPKADPDVVLDADEDPEVKQRERKKDDTD